MVADAEDKGAVANTTVATMQPSAAKKKRDKKIKKKTEKIQKKTKTVQMKGSIPAEKVVPSVRKKKSNNCKSNSSLNV